MSRIAIFRGDEFVEEVVLGRAVIGLGRHPDNDVVLDDKTLSRFHARIERRGDRFMVVDLGAQNGVHLNGERIVGESTLSPGDRIAFGRYVAVFDPVEPARTGSLADEFDLEVSLGGSGDDEAMEEVPTSHARPDRPMQPPPIAAPPRQSLTRTATPIQRPGRKTPPPSVRIDGLEPAVVLLFNGMEVSRHKVSGEVTIGRSKNCDVVISLLGLSRRHARISIADDGAAFIEDLDSQNGTWVNNERITGPRRLKHGDLMNFYDYAVLFLEDGSAEVKYAGNVGQAPRNPVSSGEETLTPHAFAGKSNDGDPTGGHTPATAAAKAAATAAPPEPASLDELNLGEGSFLEDSFEREKSGAAAALGLGDDDLFGEDDGFSSQATAGEAKPLPTDADFHDATSGGGDPRQSPWPTDKQLARALGAADAPNATIEVAMRGKPYTQMRLVQPVTRVGSDPRCELALPGILPWHLTFVVAGGTLLAVRAGRSGQILRGVTIVDVAVMVDGEVLDLGPVTLRLRMSGPAT